MRRAIPMMMPTAAMRSSFRREARFGGEAGAAGASPSPVGGASLLSAGTERLLDDRHLPLQSALDDVQVEHVAEDPHVGQGPRDRQRLEPGRRLKHLPPLP